ncbi:GLPGLI family protein [Chryseobacterium sp. KCF3-3]|uniref:GLPGLI family protein n=1 Tax=Chryseobacterium sp. KCF3-3 TaxID=3231511 RepID=UPI0038B2E26F
MRKNFLFLLLLSVFAHAQINRFYYEYKSIPDSTEKTKIQRDLMVLDIDKIGSVYYKSKERELTDSLKSMVGKQHVGEAENLHPDGKVISQERKSGGVFMMGGNNNYKIAKQYPGYKTYLIRNLGMDQYKIREDQKPMWKILSDKKKIGEYNVQKATTEFGARKWIAWFTTEIPFQDGPYKFCGLPGLIVKIEDETGSHIMTLVGNKTIQENNEDNFDVSSLLKGNIIEVNKDKFLKAQKDYYNDPAKSLKQLMSSNNMTTVNADGNRTQTRVIMKGADGKEINMNDVFKKIEESAKKSSKKNNNPIEPDLVN